LAQIDLNDYSKLIFPNDESNNSMQNIKL